MSDGVTAGLLGRGAEFAELTGLLDRAAGQRGGALVLRGEAGVGKSALAAAAAQQAAGHGLTVLSTTQYQAEMELPYAGLYSLLKSAPGLSPAARDDVMQAIRGTSRSEPHRLAQSVLELLTAEAQPLLVIVEDAQWLDRPSWDVFGFLSRRIDADPLALLIAMREGAGTAERLARAQIPVLHVAPLAEAPARLLLDRVAPGLAASLQERVLADAGGNPLGIIELGGTAARSGLGALPPSSLPLDTRMEQNFMSLVMRLPAPARTLLHVAALDDGDNFDEILAATALIVDAAADETWAPAVASGLVTVAGQTLRFRHPLLRSALRQITTVGQRVEIHTALAQVISNEDPDREVWHRAAAALGPDEQLAASLAAAASRAANLRGALDTSVMLLERAIALTEDPGQQATWLLDAADQAAARGDHATATRLLHAAGQKPMRPSDSARLTWIREAYLGGGWSGSTRLQTFAAAVDDLLAEGLAEMALEMLQMTTVRLYWSNPDEQARAKLLAVAERVRSDPDSALAVSAIAGIAPIERGHDLVQRLRRLSGGDHSPFDLFRYGVASTAVGAFDVSQPLLTRAVEGLRVQGNLGAVMQALMAQAWAAAHLGDTWLGLMAVTECATLAADVGEPHWRLTAEVTRGQLLALRGQTAEALQLADMAESILLPAGAHPMLAMVQLTRGVAALAQGRHSAAFDELYRVFDRDDIPFHQYVRLNALGLLAEAAVHSGQDERLVAIVAELEPIAALQCSPALERTLAYTRAVLAPDSDAEELFEQALSADLSAWQFEQARLELIYGTWLRRRRRPAESRDRLRCAAATFDSLGVTPWADRARAELAATGEKIRRCNDGRERLTPQELQIAQLAALGLSNRHIAERLFISPRTVSTHLYRVYPKLEIASRSELIRALSRDESHGG